MNSSIFILDAYALIYRSYFAFTDRPLTDSQGKNISAVYGFLGTLRLLRRDYRAIKIAVAMDSKVPTFRHERYPGYKANREEAPEDLHSQVSIIEELMRNLGIPVWYVERFEADDIMGSIARHCSEHQQSCFLVTPDKDLMQVVDEWVHLLRPARGRDFNEIDPSGVRKDKGIEPAQVVDYLSLIGDQSDNVPGVKGIGPKTAAKLLEQWGNMDAIYQNLDSAVKGSQLAKLRDGQQMAYLSRELVTVYCDLDLRENIGAIREMETDVRRASAFLMELGVRSFAREVRLLAGIDGAEHDSQRSGVETEVNLSGLGFPSSGDDRPGIIPAKKGHYSAILTLEELNAQARRIREFSVVSLDTETDGLDPLRAGLVGVSLAVQPGEAVYIPVLRRDGDCLPPDVLVSWLNSELEGKLLIGQNFKYDMKVLQRCGVNIKKAHFDTMIAAWLLDPSSPVGMDALARRYLDFETTSFHDVVPRGGNFIDVPLEKALGYAAEDADVTLRLYNVLSRELKKREVLQKIFDEIEMPLQPVLMAMEQEGISLHREELFNFGRELERSINIVVRETHELCGEIFNLASPMQLQEILFKKRGLKPGKKTRTGYSTDNSVLVDLMAEDPVPGKILLFRSLSKLKSTYVDVLSTLVHPEDERVHTTYSQTGAATGRLSSNNPNLQNIPVRDAFGRRIRSAFKSRPGYCFVSSDYSQIELVILAHISGDEALCEAFHSGKDVHVETAALIMGVDPLDVTPQQRRIAKAVNFGVMYGMSAFRLSNELKISRKEASHFIESYFATYSGIKSFVESTVAQAEIDGGVSTIYGRFRPISGINSRNRVQKSAAERAAVNSRIQGSAADIMKIAMIEVYRMMAEYFPQSRLLLQVHDELLIEVLEADKESLSSRLKTIMESVVSLDVPLKVNIETGFSWGDIH